MTTQFEDPKYLDEVYIALLDMLSKAVFPAGSGLKFATIERVVQLPSEIPESSQPALLLFEGPLHATSLIRFEETPREIFGPLKWVFTAIAVIYLRADGVVGLSAKPSQIANYIIWGIVNSFNVLPPYGKQTLGGLVYHAWIEGEVIPQVADQQVIITVPIHMLPGPVVD